MGDVLLVPKAGSNLLGRDLQVKLGIGVIPEDGKMTAKVLKLGQEDEEKINKEVWAGEGNRGGLNIDPISVTIEREDCPIRGFTESRNLFGQALEKILQAFSTPLGIQIIQYVDDLLLSGEDEVGEATIKLLNFLGEKGLRVSKGKLQFVEPEVKYLGHLISKGSRRLNPERIAGVLSLPPPSSKREIRKLLRLLGYCRLWIEGYTQAVKFLYEKLTEGDNIKWTKEDDDELEKLKLKLASIPALSLPSLEKPFHLYVNVEKGVAHGVLVQEWGGVKRPVAYLSKMLDPVSHSWPVCIQAIAATAILVEESRKLTFGGKRIVCTPHAVRNVLNQKAVKWLSDFRMLKYEAILIDSDDLTLEVLLATEAAIRTKERGWIHASRIKGPVEEPKEWTITSEPGDTKLTLKWGLGATNCVFSSACSNGVSGSKPEYIYRHRFPDPLYYYPPQILHIDSVILLLMIPIGILQRPLGVC
ncbi:hypothetical protein DUI87_03318 [Hirundo rustica rustica]|uniref:ribonuclease H n=1 Tax=Hirundo rustica rustica TaxID=333673 RepID=A0A3M0L713_HIRRU|nr:hypothetical protein DUI87_03318 [Hirundo rustica rustica]